MAYLPESTKQAIASCELGIRTERTDLATVVFAAGPVNLFTITGGNIAMMMLRAEVETAAIDASAGVPRYRITTAAPYAVASVYFCAAATTIANYAIGSSITVTGTTLATVALKQATIGPTLWGVTAPLVLTPGIINVTNAVPTTGNATCVIRHQIWWFPMDDNSTVVAS